MIEPFSPRRLKVRRIQRASPPIKRSSTAAGPALSWNSAQWAANACQTPRLARRTVLGTHEARHKNYLNRPSLRATAVVVVVDVVVVVVVVVVVGGGGGGP